MESKLDVDLMTISLPVDIKITNSVAIRVIAKQTILMNKFNSKKDIP